ncbi:nif-specific transcriptional activator NifA [Candidatus Magnetominusculus xianensis]|uniref:Nif-specific transcriptional activator NifA n=2 Tax=Candidatus Magnetominusculus xianensis TaxID=1748249 RepID=A0ABR5SDA1_9BACT|nr:nif-specific transcriptional activator NifA [Candidatus Magnetominusculus xianensis]MBF0405322.1 sigma 54-interacting transcriptional regulator [Nitrospirota bacterium]
MKVLSDFLDMQRGTVALVEGDEIVIKAAHGLTIEELQLGRYKLGEGIIGQVAKSGYPIVVPNVGDEPVFLNRTGARKDINKSNIAFLCVPIMFKRDVLGVLSVDRLFADSRVSFDADLRLLKIIASLLTQHIKLSRQVEQEVQELIAERETLKSELRGKYRIENIIGKSSSMQDVFESVHRVAGSRATVLITGESGTGKELIAKAIHYMSARAKQPFIKLNCAAIPEGLLETELFGHEKGAFTGASSVRRGRFELANKGTIFLDEIGDLSLGLQPKILRVIQEREFERIGSEKTIKVDVRVIAATAKDLIQLVGEGDFREDLFYRLNVVPMFLPPLRQRMEDMEELIAFFLDKYNKENSRNVEISQDTVSAMAKYWWPGNIRELENTIERLVIMLPGRIVHPRDLPLNIRNFTKEVVENRITPLDKAEKEGIIEALRTTDGVLVKAAKLLGITPRQIGYKVKKYGIRKGIS